MSGASQCHLHLPWDSPRAGAVLCPPLGAADLPAVDLDGWLQRLAAVEVLSPLPSALPPQLLPIIEMPDLRWVHWRPAESLAQGVPLYTTIFFI